MSNYQPVKRGISREEDFRRMDLLPRAIKEVYWRAPMEVGAIKPEHVRLVGVEMARAHEITRVADFAAKHCAKAYGKDHPCLDRLQRAGSKGREMMSRAVAATQTGRAAP